MGTDGFEREGSNRKGQKEAEGKGDGKKRGRRAVGGEGGGSDRKEVGCNKREKYCISKNIENYSTVV
jgi:hypothetical protein